MSAQLPPALGLGIRELAQALALVTSTVGAAALAGAAAGRVRWLLRRPRRGALSAGPWPPVERGVRVLLEGGPARLRAGPLTVVVEDGGTLVIGGAGPPGAGSAREVVVGRGKTLRVAAAQLGELEEPLAAGRAVWLCLPRR